MISKVTTPSLPVTVAQGQEMTFPKSRSLMADAPLHQSLHSSHPHYSLLCGHHVYIVTSSPKDGWELLRHPGQVGMLPPGDSVDLGSEQGLLCPIFAPRPSPSPPNSQHSTNPANQKRILILEAKKGACQFLSDMARGCQALCPWTPSSTQGKRAFS